MVEQTKDEPEKQHTLLTDLFTRVGRIQYLLLALIASGIVFFGKNFIVNIWAGPDYADSYIVALLLIIPASVALIQNIGIEIQRAENNHRFRSIVYACMAIVNLVLSIFLCQRYGAVGSALGTAVSLVLANGVVMNIYYHKKCNINILFFWKNILRMSLGLIIPVAVGILINRFVNLNDTLLFFVSIAVYSLVYSVSMWLFGMNEYEKGLLMKPIKKIVKRIKR